MQIRATSCAQWTLLTYVQRNNKSTTLIDDVFSKRMDSNTQLWVGFKRIWLMFKVTLLCGSIVNSRFIYCSSIEFNWLGIVSRLRFIVLGFAMLCMIRKRRLSKWRQIKMCFVFMLICPNNLINMASMSLSFLLPNMTSHRQTHSKDKSAKLKKQS